MLYYVPDSNQSLVLVMVQQSHVVHQHLLQRNVRVYLLVVQHGCLRLVVVIVRLPDLIQVPCSYRIRLILRLRLQSHCIHMTSTIGVQRP
jgi:hypothetical protein